MPNTYDNNLFSLLFCPIVSVCRALIYVVLLPRANYDESLSNKVFSLYCSEEGKEMANNEAPENNPQYTTVYVGNLAPEVRNFFTCP